MAVVNELPVTALPTKAQAARMLCVHKSRLSRIGDLAVEEAGGRQYLLPETVLDLNHRFRHAVERKLARQLIDHAKANAPEHADEIGRRVRAWLRGAAAERPTPSIDRSQFLESWGAGLGPAELEVLARVYDQAAAHGRLPQLMADHPSR
jgi:hypothetical protein